MALRRGFSLSSRPRSAKRPVAWGAGPGSETQTQISTSSNNIIGSGVVLVDSNKATIVRIRGQLSIYLSAVGAALDVDLFAFGIGLVSDQAFAAGAASVPDPFDDSSWDGWMYHRFGSVASEAAAIASGVEGMRVFRDTVDSKAMRKWGANQTVIAVLSVTEVGTAPVIQVNFDSRMLIKL